MHLLYSPMNNIWKSGDSTASHIGFWGWLFYSDVFGSQIQDPPKCHKLVENQTRKVWEKRELPIVVNTLPPPKLTYMPLKMGLNAPKRNARLPIIHFQVQNFSFREGKWLQTTFNSREGKHQTRKNAIIFLHNFSEAAEPSDRSFRQGERWCNGTNRSSLRKIQWLPLFSTYIFGVIEVTNFNGFFGWVKNGNHWKTLELKRSNRFVWRVWSCMVIANLP